MREIITLQLGQQSNYLGTHFWNAQESYFTYGPDEESSIDHDVHFRPGIGSDGSETYTPRTVIYDLKGGFGSLRQINALYEMDGGDAASSSLWNGQAAIHRQQQIEPSSYQKSLDAGLTPAELSTRDVRYWSDFNRVFFHPKSLVQLNEYDLNSSIRPFEKWNMGEELFATLDKEHDLLDRDLRPFVEESDQLQGIQVMAGIDDAWGGFASRYLERLRDEYGKAPVLVWGVQDPTTGLTADKRLLKLVNKARTLAELNSQASLLVPLALPRESLPGNIQLDPSSSWHVSALFAAAVESATLPTRLKSSAGINSSSLGTLTDLLNVFGKQTIASLEFEPTGPPKSGDGIDTSLPSFLDERGELLPSLADVGPDAYADIAPRETMESMEIDLSSPEELDLYRNRTRQRKRHVFSQVQAYRGEGCGEEPDAQEATQKARYALRNGPKVHRYRAEVPFPLVDSYPYLFRDGRGNAIRECISVGTAMSTTSSVTEKVKGLRSTVLRYIGLEDREDIGNELAEIAENYKEGWSSGSDDDDDDD